MLNVANEYFYGVAVGVIKDEQLYMSRRSDTAALYPKKWQMAFGVQKSGETSGGVASRLLREQMGLTIKDVSRFDYICMISNKEKKEFFFLFLINLHSDEVPTNSDESLRSDWRLFKLDSAQILDMIPGMRPIVRKLHLTLIKHKNEEKALSKILTQKEINAMTRAHR